MTLFTELYGRPAVFHGAASGRVNLIGEHTDYNGGFVLPTALAQRTSVALSLRDDLVVNAATAAFGSVPRPMHYEIGLETRQGDWRDYVQGVTAILRREGLPLRGLDLLITSDVPMGAGVSSSAALLVALWRALRLALTLPLDDLQIARLSQTVENDFVGAHVGIMDQMAASLADLDVALFIDTQDLSYRRLALPADKMSLFVINSGVTHSNVHGGYNARRAECEAACKTLRVAQLRALTEADLGQLAGLPETLQRRVRHVVSENARVLAAVGAIECGDVVRLGHLFAASHASMRDDYEVSVNEVDCLVRLASADPQVFGARLTGGGFGGSVVGLAHPGAAQAAAHRIRAAYERATGIPGSVLMP